MGIFITFVIIGFLFALIKMVAGNSMISSNVSQQENLIVQKGITATKQIEFRSFQPRWYWRVIFDDSKNTIHIFTVNNDCISIPYSKLTGREAFVNSQSTGSVKRAIVGGLIGGGAGAIVGAITAKSKVDSFVLVLSQNDLQNPQIPLTLIDKGSTNAANDYNNACIFANDVAATIRVVLNRQ